MRDDLKVGLQYLTPKHALTRLMGKLANLKAGWFTTAVIKWFIKQYHVDMSEAKVSDPSHYRTFNDFFVRELKPALRPIDGDEATLVFPADACVSQAGAIEQGRLIQAKGHSFSLTELVGGDDTLAAQFDQGEFATLYLSPRDYHRVHMPCDGVLREMIYIPGDLFSVNPLTAENVPNLFARNERVVCVFDTAFGPMAQILVGATIVGSIETTWAGTVTPPTGGSIRRWQYPTDGEQAMHFAQGEEMGRFKLGSTVINLFPKGAVRFDDAVLPGEPTQLGQAYAHRQH
ncbi:phosphatidylserine decarboxylase [Salinivibrio sp. VYel9]|uniref:Phosphatidylserine decarboxylase proenzyme n=2 Tax=Vibrionaceae TaxID=641 RepID=A0ABX3KDB6_9GAMM|nr:phosphatidylserine decarboxylase [Salinivibrio sp. KP-1]MPS32881.1 phosphatidylserine decarboxylase [Salinivibrio sp. VYel7]MPX94269.1 phosphatidylserine decarboxylase [Salinivibrio sp. VYel9]MPX97333.1 phosphatidylserine decarboxylase [Salinivibrio sp. VYel6]MPY00555.1 phosphatidylserine decarboxylase [Salinivibrio sp. VYel4]MPY03442.1 phosphatidylserine decarboxylase [Salinivibrio sp. VYel5]MPY06422.1 phosphatidylserine decarboxylase [Salinivibrio sp. VYel8]MPY14336.1 phosphatidylserine